MKWYHVLFGLLLLASSLLVEMKPEAANSGRAPLSLEAKQTKSGH